MSVQSSQILKVLNHFGHAELRGLVGEESILSWSKTIGESPSYMPCGFLHSQPGLCASMFTSAFRAFFQPLFSEEYAVVHSALVVKDGNNATTAAFGQRKHYFAKSVEESSSFTVHGQQGKAIAVQPTAEFLERCALLRFYLQDALLPGSAPEVVQRSHTLGFCDVEELDHVDENLHTCLLKAGDAMLIKPLLLQKLMGDQSPGSQYIELLIAPANASPGCEWLETYPL